LEIAANYLRSASLDGYMELAQSVGLSPCDMLDRVGLPRLCLTDPDLKVPTAAVLQLLEESARASGAEDFGLRLGELRAFSITGALGLAIRDRPTIRSALQALNDHMYLASDSMYLRVEESRDMAIVVLGLNLAGRSSGRQGYELFACVVHRMLRSHFGKDWRPKAVCFSHAAPTDLRTHRRLLGLNVEFGHDFNGLVIERSDLDAHNAAADPVIARQIERYLEHLGGRSNANATDRVRERVLALLPTGACNVERVAQHLGVDRRTVHRRLAAESCTFTELVQTIRCEYAAHYLCNGRRSMADVAGLLGFSAQSAFTRWFRAQFGCSPSAWRREQLRPGAAVDARGARAVP
jgi:AraC-like DNA-binding protein